MPLVLTPAPFTLTDQPRLIDFHCGTQPWEMSVADWITGVRVVASMDRGTSVWLYNLPDGATVGFGSAGTTEWMWPDGEIPNNLTVSIIPALAIHADFQGQPLPIEGDKYSTQIMDHLLSEVYKHDTDYLVLEVHCKNDKAIKLYESYSFTMVKRCQIRYFGGVEHVYRRMFLKKR